MNRAFEEGKRRYSWWPDWEGESAVIVASGKSTKNAPLHLVKDRIHVLAVKANIDLVPDAEVCYGCDEMWWKMRNGLPEYKGVKLAYASTLQPLYKDIRKVEVDPRDLILVDEPLRIGSGGNSGFQAINLAVQFGAKDILLVGYDIKGDHWYGRNKPPMNNPAQSNFDRWLKGFESAAPGLQRMGVTIVNTSNDTAIKCFAKAGLEESMRLWGLLDD